MLNGAGHWINNKYGFGALDTTAAVHAAINWTNVGPETTVTSGTINIDKTIPDENPRGLTSSVTIDRLMKIETVEVVFDATHPLRGDLRVVLTSPDGTQSVLAEEHDDANADFDQWTFTTNRDWDEIAKGTWTLSVIDEDGGNIGTWNSWRLNIYGTAVTDEQYVSLADGQVARGVNFGARPLAGPRVVLSGFFPQSGPMRLLFSFDKDISTITADDLDLKNDTTGAIIPASVMHVDYASGNRTATWTFPGFSRGILPDGNYTARLKAASISTPGGGLLDGNSDGIGGDDFVTTFFQLLGDANRDRKVDTTDLKILLSHFGGNSATTEQGDLTYDGKVDFHDFQAMEIAFGNALSTPVVQPAQAVPVLSSGPVMIPKPAPIAPVDSLFSTRPIRRQSMDLLDTPIRL
jgi:subtilisin-like proprotein convertase family protein